MLSYSFMLVADSHNTPRANWSHRIWHQITHNVIFKFLLIWLLVQHFSSQDERTLKLQHERRPVMWFLQGMLVIFFVCFSNHGKSLRQTRVIERHVTGYTAFWYLQFSCQDNTPRLPFFSRTGLCIYYQWPKSIRSHMHWLLSDTCW